MANKHTRDFGLHNHGAGKGDVSRTDQASPEWQNNYKKLRGMKPKDRTGFKKTGASKWTRKF